MCRLELVLTGDEEIRALNAAYRGKDKATDVLSFSELEGARVPGSAGLLGSIVISLDTTARQARRWKVTPSLELLRLLIHGILHLLGHDHEKVPPAKARRMRRLERELMKNYAAFARGLIAVKAAAAAPPACTRP